MKVQIKKKFKGKPKVVNNNEVKRVFAKRTQNDYVAVVKCKSCETGLLKPVQWNRLVCNKCWYSELV
jgi:hypothetical protein